MIKFGHIFFLILFHEWNGLGMEWDGIESDGDIISLLALKRGLSCQKNWIRLTNVMRQRSENLT